MLVKQLVLAVCLAVGTAGTAGAEVTPGPLPPAADRDLGRAILRELVNINTTHAHGTTAAAQVMQQQLLAAGFPAQDVVLIAPADKPTKGNLIVRLHGRHHDSRHPPLLMLGHLDVVEARREDWTTDPFTLTEQDGWFYGRGTEDMKGGDATMLESLIRLGLEHFRPARDLIVAFTADEEAGGDANGPQFLLREHRDLIDAGLVINLDGGGGNLQQGVRRYFEIGTSEKNYVTFTAETTGPGGHGSRPGPDNPIYELAAGLQRLAAFRFPAMTTATTRASFAQLAVLGDQSQRDDLQAVAAPSPDPAAADRLSSNVYLNAQLRTTCVATLISGGHAENALPQRARATLQCRMLPNDTPENVQATLVRVLADPKITLTLDAAPILSPESPPTREILDKAARVAHSMWPRVPLIPTMATGFSDDRQTRNAGIPSYDLSGLWMDNDDDRAHGRDERISVQAFDEYVEYTYRLIKEFAGR